MGEIRDSVSILNEIDGMLLRSEFIGTLLKYFDLRGKSILEVETGNGQYCIELSLRGAKCTGIDKDLGSINLANRIANDYQIENCLFEEKNLYDFDKSDFDIIISMGFSEHLNNSEIVNMLKKMKNLGKYIVMGIPCIDGDFSTLSGLFEEVGLSIFYKQIIGLNSVGLSQKLTRLFNGDNDVGNWLIAIGSAGDKLEEKIPEEGVSIIIPVYNGKKYIERSIENLKNLEYPNLEIIYVNDCSTDDTKILLQEKLRNLSDFQLINLENNLGEHKARYEGLKKAKDDYIFFVDIDDLIFPGCIGKLMRDLKNCPENTYLSNSCALMNNGKFTGVIWYHQYLKSVYDHIISELFSLSGKISLGNTIIKKSNLLKAYDELNTLYKKIGIERMKVAPDTLLLDIMVFSGLIEHIIPVYYTYRGYEQSPTSASQQIGDRINDIPIQTAYCFVEIRKKFDVNEKELENGIIYRAIKNYEIVQGTKFVNNFKKYREIFEEII